MKIVQKEIPLEVGRFGEPTTFGEFWVSSEIFKFTERNGIHSIFELSSWVATFTEAASHQIGWPVETIKTANQILQSQMDGLKWDEIYKEYHFGAMPPGNPDLTAQEIAEGKVKNG